MSDKKRRRARHAASSRARERPKAGQILSLLLPVLVLALVVGLIVWAVVSQEKRRESAAAALTAQPESVVVQTESGPATVAVVTAQPLTIPGPDVPRITVKEAKEKLDSQKAVLVDVRSADSYAEKHAAGAISIPDVEMEARVRELPADKEWIFY